MMSKLLVLVPLSLITAFFYFLFTKLPIDTLKAYHTNYGKSLFDPSSGNENYDFIIVGSGSAGAVVATRLSENPDHSVLLLEAGSTDENLAAHIPAIFNKLFETDLDWNYNSIPQKDSENNVVYYPRGKLLGGSSSMNAMQYCRGTAYDFDDWVRLGFTKWNWESALFYFKKSENNAKKNPSENFKKFHGFDGPWHIEDNPSPFPIMADALQALSHTLQLPILEDLNSYDYQPEGVAYLQRNVKNGERHSLSTAFLNKEVLQRTNLYVKTKAQVIKVLFNDQKEAIGVQVDHNNQTKTIYANKEVILSAGALNSPQILMLSGIGDPNVLSKYNIPIVHPNDQVGQNLKDHPTIPIVVATKVAEKSLDYMGYFPHNILALIDWILNRNGGLQSQIGEVSGFFRTTIAEKYGERAPDIQILAGPVLYVNHGRTQLPQYKGGLSIGAILLNEKSTGYVTINSGYYKDKVIIDPKFFEVQEDFDRIIEAVERLEAVFNNPILKNQTEANITPGENLSREEKLKAYKRAMFSLYHPVSTCAIGKVVDEDLKVYGVKRLRVVDASIMPVISRCNTNAPSVMIGEKGADIIKSDYLK